MSTGKNLFAFTHNELNYYVLEDYSEHEQKILDLIKDRKSWVGYSDQEILEEINSCRQILCAFDDDTLAGMLAIRQVTDFPGGRWAELGLYNTVQNFRIQKRLFQRFRSIAMATKLDELSIQCCKNMDVDFMMVTLYKDNWSALRAPAALGYSYWNELQYKTCSCGIYYLPLHDNVSDTMLYNAFGERLEPPANWLTMVESLSHLSA